MRRTATASNSTRQGQLGAKRRRVAREPDDDSSSGSAGIMSRLGAPFQNLLSAFYMARTQWPLKGADGFVRARSSGIRLHLGPIFIADDKARITAQAFCPKPLLKPPNISGKTGAPFSHLPTGGRAGVR